jgi:hypothetical protein
MGIPLGGRPERSNASHATIRGRPVPAATHAWELWAAHKDGRLSQNADGARIVSRTERGLIWPSTLFVRVYVASRRPSKASGKFPEGACGLCVNRRKVSPRASNDVRRHIRDNIHRDAFNHEDRVFEILQQPTLCSLTLAERLPNITRGLRPSARPLDRPADRPKWVSFGSRRRAGALQPRYCGRRIISRTVWKKFCTR